jgi:hypothetical protein
MMIHVEFGRSFRLNLDNGSYLDFKAGPQLIEDSLTGHWFVQANRVDIDPLMATQALGVHGTKDYLQEDLELARKILEEERASQERIATLRGLRSRAVKAQINSTIAGMVGIDDDSLTPEQKLIVQAARRQAEHQARERADATSDLLQKALNEGREDKPVLTDIHPVPGPAQATLAGGSAAQVAAIVAAAAQEAATAIETGEKRAPEAPQAEDVPKPRGKPKLGQQAA